jgi:DNA-binding HxlR family transcriptional regulator
VRSYREYCPIARASEILAERWTPLVVRNLLYGCRTFSDIARGVPAMSRSLLIKRLKELDRAGVVRKAADGTYELTEAGADLAAVIDALGVWGERWLEVTTEHTDPGFALWSWARYYLEADALPQARALVEFEFPDEPPTNRRYWLLVERGAAELCYSHPGGEPDVFVTAASDAFTRWHVGTLDWRRALADGSIRVAGSPRLARAVPGWNRHPTPMAAPARASMSGS